MVWNPRRVVGVIGGVLFALAVEGPCAAQSIGSTTLQAEAAPASDVAVVEEDRLLAHLRALEYPRADPQGQARASAYITRQLLGMGYEVTLTPIGPSENIIARLPGTTQPDHVVIIGAHYDTVPGTSGADDNTSGVAGLLEAARVLADARPARTIEFIAFTLEEIGLVGSREHARAAVERKRVIDAVLILEMIGYTCDQPGCQFVFRDAPPCLDVEPEGVDVGTFIGAVGNTDSRSLVDAFHQAAAESTPDLEVVRAVVAGNGECFGDTRRSDHSGFWDAGFKALMITDTSNFRNPNYHKPSDAIETLDMAFMRKVTSATAATAMALASAE
ncbi:MAG: M20/M25/M40 family metallo-hydrolase [Planctomycetota bacterium]